MHKLTILFVLSIFLTACGQQGPLYHPEPLADTNKPAQDTSKPELTKDKQ